MALDARRGTYARAETERAELKRRSILSPDFNEEDEIASEREGLEPEEFIDPVNGDEIPTNSNEPTLVPDVPELPADHLRRRYGISA